MQDSRQKEAYETAKEEFQHFLSTYHVLICLFQLAGNPKLLIYVNFLFVFFFVVFFVVAKQKNLNQATTFNLISSHGRVEELLYFATVIEDYDRVLSHFIQKGEYLKALEVLGEQVILLHCDLSLKYLYWTLS